MCGEQGIIILFIIKRVYSKFATFDEDEDFDIRFHGL